MSDERDDNTDEMYQMLIGWKERAIELMAPLMEEPPGVRWAIGAIICTEAADVLNEVEVALTDGHAGIAGETVASELYSDHVAAALASDAAKYGSSGISYLIHKMAMHEVTK